MVLPLWVKLAGAAGAGLLTVRVVARAHAAPASHPEPPRPHAPAPTIRLGSTGPAVAWWRWRAGLPPTPASFDQATHAATVAWQASRGLAADGVVGPATWAAAGVGKPGKLPSTPKPPTPPTQPPKPPAPPQPTPENVLGLAESIPEREQQILAVAAGGEFEHEWYPVSWTANGRTVSLLVSRKPFMLRRGPYRLVVSTTFPTAQKIGDMIGGSMLTTRVSDEVQRRAQARLQPHVRNWAADGTMARTSRMLEQSDALLNAIGGAEGLVSNAGKDWVVTRRNWPPPAGTGEEKPAGAVGSRHNGANFGWYMPNAPSKSPGGERVIQSVGLAHDLGHTDYSQLLRFVKRDSVTVDGVPVDYATALADPVLSPLLQDEGGTLPSDRHPDL